MEWRPMRRVEEPKPRLHPASAAALCLALGLAALSASGHPGETSRAPASASPSDPLSTEIARWSRYLATHQPPPSDPYWPQITDAAKPVLTAAEKALADGRRLLALQRLAAVWPLLGGTVYTDEHTGLESRDEAAFEKEWKRMGRELEGDLGSISPGAFDALRPAAVRALAEQARLMIRGCYDASLDYGRSTDLDSGLLYIGTAVAQRDFMAFSRTVSLPSGSGAAPPKLRPLAHELDDLQDRLLVAYRPPASIDRHGDFITANSTLNEARQLDTAGLRYGALLRYLDAAFRAAPLLPSPAADPAPLADRLAALDRQLASGETDHSIGRIYLERAQADLAANPAPGKVTLAEAIAADVLPRYFAALRPATPRPVLPAPAVTVTLVRWPYT
jgi:hypothetical protein